MAAISNTFVPSTLRSVVAASNRVEWLKSSTLQSACSESITLKYTTASTLTVTESRDRIYAAKTLLGDGKGGFFVANIFYSFIIIAMQDITSSSRQREECFLCLRQENWKVYNRQSICFSNFLIYEYSTNTVTAVPPPPPPFNNNTENIWYRSCKIIIKKLCKCQNYECWVSHLFFWRYFYNADSFTRFLNHAVWNATRGQV